MSQRVKNKQAASTASSHKLKEIIIPKSNHKGT